MKNEENFATFIYAILINILTLFYEGIHFFEFVQQRKKKVITY